MSAIQKCFHYKKRTITVYILFSNFYICSVHLEMEHNQLQLGLDCSLITL